MSDVGSKGTSFMVGFFAPLRHIAGVALVALAVGTAPAGATENAVMADATVAAVMADATATEASGIAKAEAAKAEIAKPEIAKPETAMAAIAPRIRVPARRTTFAASQQDRRAAFARTRLGCSGVWCGRHYVLMLGIGY